MGDFNLDVANPCLSMFMDEHSLYSLLKTPTCFKSKTGSCIDLILTNCKFSFKNTCSFETGVSDHHHLIYTMLKSTFTKLPPKKICYRTYKSFSEELFLSDLSDRLRSITPGDFSLFNQTFESTLDKHAPQKERTIRGNNQPHVNKTLRKAIMKRSKLKRTAQLSNSIQDIKIYKKQRNFVVALNRKTKQTFFSNLDSNRASTSKSFWKTCKPLFSSKLCNTEERIVLLEQNEILSDELAIANCFNNYFVNITNTLPIIKWGQHFDNPVIDPVEHAVLKYSTHPSVLKIKSLNYGELNFEFSHIYPWDTYQAIMKLNSSKTVSGPIPVKDLQRAARTCCISLTDCFNSSINNGEFPTDQKLSSVVPIHKKDDTTDKANYRPISLLPTISKVFERLLFDRMLPFIEKKLSNLLCGFRAKYSTQHALINLLQRWQHCLDKSNSIGAILMDLSKAFDCLPHDLLIAKLQAYGFGKASLKLLQSYLSKRFQKTKVGSSFSSWLEVLLGVPQGSILGPLLFNIFINDIFQFIENSEICNFADDNTIFSCDSTFETVVFNLELDAKNILNWLQINQLVANPAKFQFILLGNSGKKLCLAINKNIIKLSDEVKLLGITIDSKLTFNSHVNGLCKSASKKIKCLYRVRNFTNQFQAKLLYNTYVLSIFNYCPLVWMYCSRTANNNINRVHTRALRAIYNDVSLNLDELILLDSSSSIHVRNLRALLTEIFKSLNRQNPSFMWSLFIKKESTYDLRRSTLLKLPTVLTTKFGTKSLIFRGSLLWNSLPNNFKNNTNGVDFKEALLNWKGDDCTCHLCFSF